MSTNSAIEWTGRTWNPIRARLPEGMKLHQHKGLKILEPGTWGYHCEPVSPGCVNCYAEAMNKRTLPAWGTGLAYSVPNRSRVEIFLDQKELDAPLHWKKPTMVFACSMTDMFADFVPDEFIDRMFAVMALCQRHTFQVLTKRAERMPRYFKASRVCEVIRTNEKVVLWFGSTAHDGAYTTANLRTANWSSFPLPNVWLGISAENQQYANERYEYLRQTPAAVRFISYEPALGPLNIGEMVRACKCLPFPDWVIAGGESGSKARPFDLVWLKALAGECRAFGIPLFVKQLGSAPHDVEGRISHRADPLPRPDGFCRYLNDKKGGDPAEWPEWARIREFPHQKGEAA